MLDRSTSNHLLTMLCPISTSKTSLNWLDKLRTSKGFPVDNALNLEEFLNPNPPSSGGNKQESATKETVFTENPPENSCLDSGSGVERDEMSKSSGNSVQDAMLNGEGSGVVSSQTKKTVQISKEKKENWFEIMSDVLAELFNMGDPCEFRRFRAFDERKNGRKQLNPKFCLVAGNSGDEDAALKVSAPVIANGVSALSPPSTDNSAAELKDQESDLDPFDGRLKKRGIKHCSSAPRKESIASVNSKEENMPAIDSDLSSYSRVEVTVIDTSYPTWKSEKLVFRKGPVWKIRDKKWNLVGKVNGLNGVSARKRRKLGQFEKFLNRKEQNASCLPQPVLGEGLRECLEKNGGRAVKEPSESIMPLNQGHKGNNQLEDFKGSTDDPKQVPERRQVCLGSADHLSPDHPVNQPMGTLQFSIYRVFQQAGKMGLTAREAVSRILDEGLPGLHEGGVVPRVEVARFLRNSPYFLQLEESKFALCSEITSNEGLLSHSSSNLLKVVARRVRTSRQCSAVSSSARPGYPHEGIEERC